MTTFSERICADERRHILTNRHHYLCMALRETGVIVSEC